MKRMKAFALSLAFLPALLGFAQDAALQRADQLERQGQFAEAATLLESALKVESLSSSERKKLRFELDRLERIKKDYPYTKAELFTALKKAVKNLTTDEFEQWIAEGRFDVRQIDGERRFMSSSVSNLFFRHPELNARRIPPRDTTKHDRATWETVRSIRRAAQVAGTPYVLPKTFHATMTVTAKAGAAPAGEIIRAWLPLPREYPFQTDFKLLETSLEPKQIAPEDSPIRSIYFEQPAKEDEPTQFKIAYEYTMYGIWFEVNPDTVIAADANDPKLKPFLGEAPHIVFTPEIRALSEKILGDEKNPYHQAKKFHDWIAGNIKYSYALEYSTIRNISDYCHTQGYGDCGQEALLFMTLCRLNGIPARWQSGWNTFPGAKTIHDWCEIYIAPYGWIPVDPYKGIWAMRYAFTLTPEQKREVRDFYFGGLDYYRMAANSDHNQTLSPAKNSFRSDDVDFQRGELEWRDNNIYFDKYSYRLDIREITPTAKD